MADSLIGAVNSSSLPQTTKDLLVNFLNGLDTTSVAVNVVPVAGTTLLVGVDASGNYSGALVESSSQVSDANVAIGTLSTSLTLPAHVGLFSEGLPSVSTPTAANSYLLGLISAVPEQQSLTNAVNQLYQASPTTAVTNLDLTEKQSLTNAVNQLYQANPTINVAANVVTLTDSSIPPGSQSITLTSHNQSEIMGVNIGQLHSGTTVILDNVSNAVIVGSGSVQVKGSTPSTVIGDAGNQLITAGAGNDTLVGGGGSDTLVGGQAMIPLVLTQWVM